ncbi:MAG: serine hydrolase domain-containing protein, partial [Desulfobacteraceae bacterium]
MAILKSRFLIFLSFLFLLPFLNVNAGELPRAKPEKVGLSSERLARLDDVMRRYVDEKKLAGVLTLVARRGKIAHLSAIGKMDIEDNKAMRKDTIFRMYSMTKPITSVALLMLYEEGRFQLTDTVESHIPAFKDLKVFDKIDDSGNMVLVDQKRKMTMQDIFRHTSGLGYGGGDTVVDKAYKEAGISGLFTLQDLISKLGTVPLLYQPGERWVYSYAHDVQAYLVEHFSGMPFDKFLQKRIFEPLGMSDTSFGLPEEKLGRLSRVYAYEGYKDERITFNLSPGLAPIDMSDYLKGADYPAGGSGLVSTAEDYFRFAQMLLNGGNYNGKQILSPKTIELMTSNHLPEKLWPSQPFGGGGYGLGVSVLPDLVTAANLGSKGQFGWGGAATTYVIIDPAEEMVSLLMVQYWPLYAPIYGQFQTLVYQSIVDKQEQPSP